MKKIYSLIFLAAAALGAQAQIVLQYQGKTVEPGSTLEIRAYENVIDAQEYYDAMGMGDYYEGPEVKIENVGAADPKLVNTSNAPVEVTATVTVEDFSEFQWCFPDQCKPLEAEVTTNSAMLSANAQALLALDTHYTYMEYVETPRVATLKLQYAGKTDTYTLHYLYSESEDPHESVYKNVDGKWIPVDGIQGVKAEAAPVVRYDLTGRRIQAPQPGQLYIENGKKHVF